MLTVREPMLKSLRVNPLLKSFGLEKITPAPTIFDWTTIMRCMKYPYRLKVISIRHFLNGAISPLLVLNLKKFRQLTFNILATAVLFYAKKKINGEVIIEKSILPA